MSEERIQEIKELILDSIAPIKKVVIEEKDGLLEFQLYRLANMEGFKVPRVTYLTTTSENLLSLTNEQLIETITAFIGSEDSSESSDFS